MHRAVSGSFEFNAEDEVKVVVRVQLPAGGGTGQDIKSLHRHAAFFHSFLFLFPSSFCLLLFSIFLFREIRIEVLVGRPAVAHPWLTPGSPNPLNAAGAWPEPIAQE